MISIKLYGLDMIQVIFLRIHITYHAIKTPMVLMSVRFSLFTLVYIYRVSHQAIFC